METILSIAGKPGLYKLVSRGKMNLIVEAIDATHRRQPAFATDKVTSLGDIAMYTTGDDVPLWQVLDNVAKKEGCKEASINYKKVSGKELRAYFKEVLPEFDEDRVHDSDIRSEERRVEHDILSRNYATVAGWLLWHICCNL